ncbi:tyrosine-type recombinase/integrase, partial [Embleya sp. NPDC050493]|uniref:tyrosine-type recombinase/integrase n=1 Tax=Embleya sp. NPDC050493 TaxID=3363989 RepID=UPI0037B2F23C
MSGTTFKRCGCKAPLLHPDGSPVRDADGRVKRRELGASCPKLRRRSGSWSPTHGTWWWLFQVPTPAGVKRRHLRQGGYASETKAAEVMDAVVRLLALTDQADDPVATRLRIADLVQAAIRAKEPLPDYDETRRRLRSTRPVDEIVTVEQWLREWFAGKKDLRPTTRRSYESHLRLYLIPHLGCVRLGRLRVAHLHAMFTAIEDRNEEIAANNAQRRALQHAARAAWHARDLDAARTARARLAELPPFARPVDAGSRQRIRATLRSALTDAAAQELVTVNVAKLVSGSKPRPLIWTRERVAVWRRTGEVPSAVMVWTAEQTMRFLARAAKAKVCTRCSTSWRSRGCGAGRWSGCAGRTWISGTRSPGGWELARCTSGSRSCNSGGTLPPGSRSPMRGSAMLRWRRTRCTCCGCTGNGRRPGRSRPGRSGPTPGYVFTDDSGSPLHPAAVTDLFQRLTREEELPPIRLHDLRHGAATHALTAGVDVKVVQDMLGHSSSTLTRETYTSVADEAKHAAADAISAFLSAAYTTRKQPRPLLKLDLPKAAELYGAKADSPYVRRINLDPRVEPDAGTGWELAAERDRPGTWHVLHDGDVVGAIERHTTVTGPIPEAGKQHAADLWSSSARTPRGCTAPVTLLPRRSSTWRSRPPTTSVRCDRRESLRTAAGGGGGGRPPPAGGSRGGGAPPPRPPPNPQ